MNLRFKIFLIASLLLTVGTLFIPNETEASHLEFECLQQFHTDAFCALPPEGGTFFFCNNQDIADLECTFDELDETFSFVNCRSCADVGQVCSDTTSKCIAPPPTPTPAPLTDCSDLGGTCEPCSSCPCSLCPAGGVCAGTDECDASGSVCCLPPLPTSTPTSTPAPTSTPTSTPTPTPGCANQFESCETLQCCPGQGTCVQFDPEPSPPVCLIPAPTSTPAPAPCSGVCRSSCLSGETTISGTVCEELLEVCCAPDAPPPTNTPPPLTTFSISGVVFEEFIATENCALDPLESASTEATVTATRDSDSFSTTAQTDLTGDYSISGLSPGLYTVSASKFGFSPSETCTDKKVNLIANALNVNLALVPEPTPTPTLAPTPTPTEYTIFGLVFVDTNKDGKPQAEEKAHAGATVIATATVSSPPPTTTGAETVGKDGGRINYSFSSLSPRRYDVELSVPSGFKLTTDSFVTVTLSTESPTGRADFGIADETPPTVDVRHDPSSLKDNCSVTVTTTAADSGSGLQYVSVLVDLDRNGTYDVGENKRCSTPPYSPCEWVLPLPLPIPTGTYKYYGAAVDNAGIPNSTGEKEFTVTKTEGTFQCVKAVGCKCTKIATAIGTIDVEPTAFISRIMSLLLGLSGGIAVILIIIAGYGFITSRGNPQAIQENRERILGAIVGLLFIILALVALEVIGVDILKIPGFDR